MDNLTTKETLLQILQLAINIDSDAIAKQAITHFTELYGIAILPSYFPKSLSEVNLYTPLASSNKIRAIKELRELAHNYGLPYGLKECKEEVDRRIAKQPDNSPNW